MGNIGDSISDSAPAVGTAGPGYATTINALLTEFKARLISRIPLSSLLTNSDLDLDGQALLNAAYITMVDEDVSPVASPVNRIAAFDGDLWWVSPSGAVQITDGATLFAGSIGGITGDYDGDPMEFRYDIANTRYDAFANQSTNTWAYVRARGFDIAAGATSSFRARLLFAGASNVSFTLPEEAPAVTAPLTMNSSGEILTNGLLGTNQTITFTGEGRASHEDYNFTQGCTSAVCTSGSFPGDGATHTLVAGSTVFVDIRPLEFKQRLKKVIVKGGSLSEPTVLEVREIDASGTSSVVTTTNTGTILGDNSVTFTVDSPAEVSDNRYVVKMTAGANDFGVYGIEVFFDRV